MIYNSIEKVQSELLVMLKEIDRICRENNIVYFAESGTLLGAVRHNGFIPWDDDLDLSIYRCDVDRFISAMREQLSDKYELVLPTEYGNDAFFDQFIKIIAKGKYYVAPNEESEYYSNKPNCISADFMLIDYTGNNMFLHKIRIFLIKYVYSLCMGHRYKINYDKFKQPIKTISFLQSKVGSVFPLKTLLNIMNTLSVIWQGDKSKVFIIRSFQFMNRVYDAKSFKPSECPFCDMSVIIPEGYDKVLRVLYGDDYMTPLSQYDFDNGEYQHLGNPKLFG